MLLFSIKRYIIKRPSKLRKKSVYCLIICFLIMLTGCTPAITQPVASIQSPNITSQSPSLSSTAQSKYSFNDPNVIAYVKGVPVNKKDMDDFIIMSKAYSEALANTDESNLDVDMNNKPNGNVMNNAVDKWTVEHAKKMVKFSDEDWKKEYYKTVFIDSLYRKFCNDSSDVDAGLESLADNEVSDEINSYNILHTDYSAYGIISSGPNNNTSLDYRPICQSAIQSAADKLGISFEDCTKTIYRAFYIKDMEYIYLLSDLGPYLNQSLVKLDYGKEVEFDGNNAVEVESYIQHAYDINQNYIDSLLDTAEIVERP